MSDCRHNDHGHFLLWLFVVVLAVNCGNAEDRTKRQQAEIDALKAQVEELQVEVQKK